MCSSNKRRSCTGLPIFTWSHQVFIQQVKPLNYSEHFWSLLLMSQLVSREYAGFFAIDASIRKRQKIQCLKYIAIQQTTYFNSRS